MYYEAEEMKIMRRIVFNQLVKWKNDVNHKPLISSILSKKACIF